MAYRSITNCVSRNVPFPLMEQIEEANMMLQNRQRPIVISILLWTLSSNLKVDCQKIIMIVI